MSTEEETERDGFLSYSGEWHALTIGFGMGFYAPWELQTAFVGAVIARNKQQIQNHQFNQSGHMKDAKKEPAYTIGGLVVGNIAKIAYNLLPEGLVTL